MTKHTIANLGQAIADNLNRNVTAQAIIDEMAARKGHSHGPELSWDDATEEFKSRFQAAYAKKTRAESVDDFVRALVDHWPAGLATVTARRP